MATDLTPETIRWIVQAMVILVLSIAVHEFGHAWVADRMGDRLPRRQGRVTLNPLAHADPIGTLALPLIFLVITQGRSTGFGWGKPVEHTTYDRKRRLYISFAGPAMNVILGTVVATIHVVLLATHVISDTSLANVALHHATRLNFVLFFFNLIPAHPLDGGSVARGLIPRSWVDGWDKISVYGPFILMALIAVPALGRIILWPAELIAARLYDVLAAVFDVRLPWL